MNFSEWKKYKIGELVDNERGISYGIVQPGEFLKEGGVPILKVNNLTQGNVSLKDVYRVKKEVEGKFLRTRLTGNEILVSLVGSLGHIFRVTQKQIGWNVVRAIGVLPIKKEFNRDFIFWVLKHPDVQADFVNYATHTVQATLNLKELKEIEVSIPSSETQQRIASILCSLDDKIELNRQTNETLEIIAQTLFKETCLPKGQELSEGWEVKKLEDLIDTISVTHKMKQEKIIFLNTSDILEGNILNSDYSIVSTLPGQAKKSIKRNDILFSEIRPANKRFAFVNFDADDYVVSTKLMVLRSKGDISPYLIYCFLTNNDTLKQLQHLAETRSGTFPQITFNQLKDFQLLIPHKNKLKELSKNIESIYEMIFSNNKETQTLTTLRDSLLPKLMTGEITIQNNEI